MTSDIPNIRKPIVDDMPQMATLINYFGEKGRLLPRATNDIYEHLRDFVVCDENEGLLGCAALHMLWDGLGEIRSLAAAIDAQRKGIGRALVKSCIEDARKLGMHQVFVLTYETRFFEKFGFREFPKENLPQKVWKDCIKCPKVPNCDEIAMLLNVERKP